MRSVIDKAQDLRITGNPIHYDHGYYQCALYIGTSDKGPSEKRTTSLQKDTLSYGVNTFHLLKREQLPCKGQTTCLYCL